MIYPDSMLEPADPPAGRRTFGWELRLQLGGCDPAIVGSRTAVADWCRAICATIGMTPFGEPIVDEFGQGDLYGITAIQRITTSAVDVHCDPPDGAFVRVFSCRSFDPRVAADFCVRFFRATSATGDFTARREPDRQGFVYNFD